MPILTVRHVTAYYYKTPVAFGEHRMMLHESSGQDRRHGGGLGETSDDDALRRMQWLKNDGW